MFLRSLNMNIYKNSSSLFVVCFRTKTSQSELENHKTKLMSRGLPKRAPIDGVKNIILVSSGKGGVGKTTTSVNLALAFKHVDDTKRIGLLDSDVFGPSVPLLMNLNDYPNVDDKNMMEPLRNYGIKCMSMGFLIENESPVLWRGLMVMQALQKLMREVKWGDIDYLIVDTPPGTGDTHLSLVQNLPITGALLVTTPQIAALQVTRRGASMFKKLSVPVIGIVENMSSTICPKCATEINLFGSETVKLAKEIDCEILERIPLESSISVYNDKGTPIMVAEPDHPISNSYKKLARNIITFVERNRFCLAACVLNEIFKPNHKK